MEEEVEIKRKPRKPPQERRLWGVYIGLIFIALGIVWLAFETGLIPRTYSRFWPQVLLVIIGLLILIKSIKRI